MNIEQDLERGAKAEKLLRDSTLSQAFDDVRKAIIEQWEACPVRDHEGQHELKLMLKLLSDVRANLERAVADGKLAAAELERLNRRALSPAEFKATYR